jgi:hypothetical protein
MAKLTEEEIESINAMLDQYDVPENDNTSVHDWCDTINDAVRDYNVNRNIMIETAAISILAARKITQ